MNIPFPRVLQSPSLAVPLEGHRALTVETTNGYERLVLTDLEICKDVLATIPKLQAGIALGTADKCWRKHTSTSSVDFAELSSRPHGGLDQDPDIVYACVAKTELRCHWNEVLNVLINPESSRYEAAMKSLCGKKFESGKVLFQQRRRFRFQDRTSTTQRRFRAPTLNLPQDGLVTVQTMAIHPKLHWRLKRKAAPKLAFASCTVQYPTKDRALYVMKTLPRAVHDQIVRPDDRSPLRGGIDHIATCIDIQSVRGSSAMHSQSTRITMYTYASAVPPAEYSTAMPSDFALEQRAPSRKARVNSEARHVMKTLTKSLNQYGTVVRRRRFGFQPFINSTAADAPKQEHQDCAVCRKSFRFYRRDTRCTLCGHAVCATCSQQHEVEADVGEVSKRRCCIACVVRVDNCAFDDEDLLATLESPAVDADATVWSDTYRRLSDLDHDESDREPSVHSLEDLSASLRSLEPAVRSAALEQLARLVNPPSPEPVVLPRLNARPSLHHGFRYSLDDAEREFERSKRPASGRVGNYASMIGGDLLSKPMPRQREPWTRPPQAVEDID